VVEKGGRCRCRLFAWRRRFGVRVVTAGGIYCIATLCCSTEANRTYYPDLAGVAHLCWYVR